jgi:hypothetical protein
MAESTKGTRLDQLFGARARAQNDKQRAQLLQGQLAQASRQGFDLGRELYAFISSLPSVALATDLAEYERVAKRYGPDSERARAVEVLVENGRTLQRTAALATVRVDRVVQGVQEQEPVFHGFVSDRAAKPQPGLIVQLSSQTLREPLIARTDDAGYFRIGLPAAQLTPAQEAAQEKRAAAKNSQAEATVEVLGAGGNVLYADPVPLVVDNGMAYREYVVDASGEEPTKPQARKPKRRRS